MLNIVLPAVLAKASIKASEMVVMRLNLSNMPCSQVRLVTLCLVSWFRGGGPTRCDIPSFVKALAVSRRAWMPCCATCWNWLWTRLGACT